MRVIKFHNKDDYYNYNVKSFSPVIYIENLNLNGEIFRRSIPMKVDSFLREFFYEEVWSLKIDRVISLPTFGSVTSVRERMSVETCMPGYYSKFSIIGYKKISFIIAGETDWMDEDIFKYRISTSNIETINKLKIINQTLLNNMLNGT